VRAPLLVVACACVCAAALSGCVLARRKVVLPSGDAPAVLLLSGALAPPMSQIARHSWFAVRGQGETEWERWEVWNHGDEQWGYVVRRKRDPLRWDLAGRPALHAVWRGARAHKAIACIRRESPQYPDRNSYIPWPGPNSNTFIDWLLRRCLLDAELPATAVGKDYRGIIGASWNAGQTGAQLETPLLGLKLGFTEGVQLHLFALTIGVDIWPPALLVPFGEGRIGFDDR